MGDAVTFSEMITTYPLERRFTSEGIIAAAPPRHVTQGPGTTGLVTQRSRLETEFYRPVCKCRVQLDSGNSCSCQRREDLSLLKR